MKLREYFLSLVHPNSLSIAEDFVNGKIDAMFIEYTPKGSYRHAGPDRSRIEIFENDPDTPSKIIKFNDSEHMTIADKFMICGIVGRYGYRHVYEDLKRLDTDENLRNEIMTMYMRFPNALTTIARKKCQKIYESLSDSDKLLLEISDDNYGVRDPFMFYL